MRFVWIAFCLVAASGPAAELGGDLASRVAESGGSVTRDGQGRIVAVDLRASWVTDIDLESLAAASSIEELDLANTHITDVGLEAVAKLPNLKSLDLFFCEHITEAGVAYLKDIPGLERLNLRGARVSDSGMAFLAQIPTLKSLDIGVTQITGPAFEHFEALEQLEELSIGGNRVGDLGLSYLQTLPALKSLDVSGSQVTDSGVWGVTVTDVNVGLIALLSGLEELNLAASDAEYIANIGDGVPRLRNRIELTDLGVAKLADLERLRSLNLSRSGVTEKGLAALAKLPLLEALTLAYAPGLGDSAAEAFLAMPRLRVLDLTAVNVSDALLSQLAKHPNLEKLIVSDSAVTAAGAAAFEQKNASCGLIW